MTESEGLSAEERPEPETRPPLVPVDDAEVVSSSVEKIVADGEIVFDSETVFDGEIVEDDEIVEASMIIVEAPAIIVLIVEVDDDQVGDLERPERQVVLSEEERRQLGADRAALGHKVLNIFGLVVLTILLLVGLDRISPGEAIKLLTATGVVTAPGVVLAFYYPKKKDDKKN